MSLNTMTEPLITIENLTHCFKTTEALKNLNLTLPQGEMIGIIGPDGAGKTTLLRLIASLLYPTKGKIKVFGYDTVLDAEKIRNFSGYMPQRFGLYEDLTVQENLDLYAALRGVEKNKLAETFKKLLAFTKLEPFTKRLAGALSGGMKQKLGLACALIQKPRLLILDEPSVGVDPISRRELWSIVHSLLEEGVSVLWSTTYLDEAEKCKEVVLLNEGTLLHVGDPFDLTKRVEGRVFRIEDDSPEKRQHLLELEKREDVIDVSIQGKDLRVVAKSSVFELGEPTIPRFEDAFIDLLGGLKKEESKLAKAAPITTLDGDAVLAKHLVRRFGSFTAVGDISFAVKRGEIFGLLGPNGAGKSTTFKMLCGLLTPTSGQAFVDGIDLQKAPGAARAKIGYMAQKFSLYDNLTVGQNLSFFGKIYSRGRAQTHDNLDKTLELFDLQEHKHTFCQELPLGLKQRVALAAAISHWPDVLFLDEPTSGMDPVSRRQFWSQMNSLVKKGKTILVSTHFMDEAENCDRIALIYRGLIIHLGTPDQLKDIAKTEERQNPTLEDAFAQLIEEYNAAHP
jgi:ABC-2 type transport system ATP-binding protein